MVANTKTLSETERAAKPITRQGDVVVRQHRDDGSPGYGAIDDHDDIVTGGSPERVATYAQRIKKKTAKGRKAPARSAAKSAPAAARKPEPAAAPKPAAPPVASGDLQRLRDELQRVNQEISRLARVTRPGSDPARHSQLPEKQELLRQKADLDRKIRALS